MTLQSVSEWVDGFMLRVVRDQEVIGPFLVCLLLYFVYFSTCSGTDERRPADRKTLIRVVLKGQTLVWRLVLKPHFKCFFRSSLTRFYSELIYLFIYLCVQTERKQHSWESVHTHTHTHTFVSITFGDITLTYIHSL